MFSIYFITVYIAMVTTEQDLSRGPVSRLSDTVEVLISISLI